LHGLKLSRKERANRLLVELPRIYPDAKCALEFSNPLELLIATILSAQCTDKCVNLVTRTLFERCKTAADYASISQEELEKIIRPTGFFRNKAKNIRACAAELLRLHGGEVPRELDALAALPGVGRKTANVVLGNAFNINAGMVVDTHIARLSRRFDLTRYEDPVKIEADLMRLFPRDSWKDLSHWLIAHGRARCTARNPDCAGCELVTLCPTAFTHSSRKSEKRRSKNMTASQQSQETTPRIALSDPNHPAALGAKRLR
jgi:endonuclease-3